MPIAQPSVQDKLDEALERIKQLEDGIAKQKLDERFQDLASRIKLGLDKADAERAVIRGNLTTVAEQLQQNIGLLNKIANKVDENSERLSTPIMFQLEENGNAIGQPVPKLLGETLFINRQQLK